MEEIKTIEFECRSQIREKTTEEGKRESFLSYQVKTKLGWISLIFPKEKQEQFNDDVKEILKLKFFKILVPNNDLAWNIKSRNGFDVMYVSEILSAEETKYLTKKEKYFG